MNAAFRKITLFPDLTSFRHCSLCFCWWNRNHGLQRRLPATGREQSDWSNSITADLRVINCIPGLTISKKSTSLPNADTHRKQTWSDKVNVPFYSNRYPCSMLNSIQYTLLDRYINGSAINTLVVPFRESTSSNKIALSTLQKNRHREKAYFRKLLESLQQTSHWIFSFFFLIL